LLNRKAKGDLAELKVAADLRARGYKIAFPYGEDWDFDLIVAHMTTPRDACSTSRPPSSGRACSR
jgi:hypothetical protein